MKLQLSLFNILEITRTPAAIHLLKDNNEDTRTIYEICSKLTIKIPLRLQWPRSGVSIINFEQILHIVLVFHLLNLNN